MSRITVNGISYEVPAGLSVLDALGLVGVHVPALCHDDRVAPTGECRSCLVRLGGVEHLAPACATPLADGMAIETETPELAAHRRSLFTLLASGYPADAVAAHPDKPFHQELHRYAADAPLAGAHDPSLADHSHPYIAIDMSQCIHCDRCVRICDQLQGQHVWHVRDRGHEVHIVPDGPDLLHSSCVSCGACVDTCPTGALEDATRATAAPASRWTRTTCPYCGTGCEMHVGTHDNAIVSVRPVDDAPVSRGHLCVKGRYGLGFVGAVDRMTRPMIRGAAGWRAVSWPEVEAFVAEQLRRIVEEHGADAVGLLGSARATNEDNYVAQKFARVAIGTNNVDCCARVCHAPSAAGLKAMFGAGLATNAFADIEVARTLLVVGANPTEDHPIVGARIRQAAWRGATLIVVDPRRIELAEIATCHLAIRPGTNVALLNAMAHTIVSEGLSDQAFIERRVEGFDAFARFVAEWPAERAASVCGVDADEIRRAARLYATSRPSMSMHGLGLTEHVQGVEGVMALCNLALVTGNIGVPGSGVNPLRGQNNVQGAAHMGCDPAGLPGSTPIEAGRETFEQVWQARLPHTKGLQLLDMMDAAAAGRLKALWTIGYDIFLTNPRASETARALRSLDLVIVQDLFLNETAREFGTVFLPACSSFEKDGTFMNGERRIQRVRRAIEPLGESRADWRIVADIARAMGVRGFDFASAEAIWDEVRALCSGARGMSYARLDRGGLQWPCPSADHPGTALLHRDAFVTGPRATLRCIEPRISPEVTSAEYPFVLITGRTLLHFNAGTMTSRTRNAELRPVDLLDISPVDADALGIADGEVVSLVSHYGAARLPAHVSTSIAPGQLFTTFQSPQVFVNRVTSPHRDVSIGTPEYKVTAVRVDRVV